MSRETIGNSGLDRSPNSVCMLPCRYLHNRVRKRFTSQDVILAILHLQEEKSSTIVYNRSVLKCSRGLSFGTVRYGPKCLIATGVRIPAIKTEGLRTKPAWPRSSHEKKLVTVKRNHYRSPFFIADLRSPTSDHS